MLPSNREEMERHLSHEEREKLAEYRERMERTRNVPLSKKEWDDADGAVHLSADGLRHHD